MKIYMLKKNFDVCEEGKMMLLLKKKKRRLFNGKNKENLKNIN